MIGGVFFVLTGYWSWDVILASIPVGLNVVTINLGKHTDKRKEDLGKGVRTLPVLVGETAARTITMAAILLSYLSHLFDLRGTFLHAQPLLLILIATPAARTAIQRMMKPASRCVARRYLIWPRCSRTVCFIHNRVFSNYFVLGLIIDTAIRSFGMVQCLPPAFWH